MIALMLASMFAAALPSSAVRWVQVDSIAGLRALPDQRAEFLQGFHATMREETLPTEVSGPEGWKRGAALANRFREAEGSATRDAWTLRVQVRLPAFLTAPYVSGYWQNDGGGGGHWVPGHASGRADARRRMKRAMTLAIAVTDPRARLDPAPPVGASLVFPLPASPEGGPPVNRFDFPWREAGRATALLALEALHRESHEIGGEVRMALDPALRSERLLVEPGAPEP